jgi:predicted nucleotide-binding protein (sugar kinase/HSP70/actin superfamily)
MGMNEIAGRHWRPSKPPPLTERDARQSEFLFGGLHWRTNRLIEEAFANLGYRARGLPTATRQDLLTGKELADIGQCCPTSFTTGNLVNFLKQEAGTLGPEEVKKRYVFLTMGACGACRFGQYHLSYELALRNVGLDGFRLMLLDQMKLDQADGEDGRFQPDMPLLMGAAWAAFCGDVIQGIEYRTRPFEVVPGATERASRQAVEILAEAFRNRPKRGKKWGSLAWHLATPYFASAMKEARKAFDAVEVDRLRPKPLVKITGEFYLHSVEGDPNYNMHSWLEAEGAEVYPAATAVWFDYLARWTVQEMEARRETTDKAALKIAAAKGVQRMLRFTYDRLRNAMGGVPHEMPPQEELKALAAPYFHHSMSGGEGDMLIGKAIWAHKHRHAHMICELSPYACLPNTMSVGAMARVLGDHPDLLYAPIEVKGDAEVHALSRCQMILTEAKKRATAEFEQALKVAGMTLDQAKERAADDADMRRATWKLPHHGAAGTAANAVLHLAGKHL